MGKSQGPVYVVRNLIQYKIIRKVEYVLVWWMGYRKDEATWEPLMNVLTIELFQQQLAEIKEKWRRQQAQKKNGKRKRENLKNTRPIRKENIAQKEQSSQEAIVEEDEEDQEDGLSEKIFKQIGKMPLKRKIIQKPSQKQQNRTQNWLKGKEPSISTPHKGTKNFKDEYMSQSKNRKCQFQLNNLFEKHALKQKDQASILSKQLNINTQKEEVIASKQEQVNRSIQQPSEDHNINQKEMSIFQEKPMKIQIPIGQFIQNGRQRMNLKPMKFEIRIKEYKDLPFRDQQLKEIKKAYYKDGQLLYDIVFDGNRSAQPIVIDERYLRVMWPRKYAEHLISKIQPSDL